MPEELPPGATPFTLPMGRARRIEMWARPDAERLIGKKVHFSEITVGSEGFILDGHKYVPCRLRDTNLLRRETGIYFYDPKTLNTVNTPGEFEELSANQGVANELILTPEELAAAERVQLSDEDFRIMRKWIPPSLSTLAGKEVTEADILVEREGINIRGRQFIQFTFGDIRLLTSADAAIFYDPEKPIGGRIDTRADLESLETRQLATKTDNPTRVIFDDENERLSDGARKTLALIDRDVASSLEIIVGSEGFEIQGRPVVSCEIEGVGFFMDRSDTPWFYDPATGKRMTTHAALGKITGGRHYDGRRISFSTRDDRAL